MYQNLAVSPALDVAANLFLGREERRAGLLGSVFRMLDTKGMRQRPRTSCQGLGISTLQDVTVAGREPVRRPAPGRRRRPRRGVRFSKVVVLDEPTAALGVRESNQVLQLVQDLRDHGLPVILISHNMPHVFEVADRIHIQRLGTCAKPIITPQTHTMTEAVAIMTGAMPGDVKRCLARARRDRCRWRGADRPHHLPNGAIRAVPGGGPYNAARTLGLLGAE